MRDTDREERRNQDRGIGAGKDALTEAQRDVSEDAPHMPRHWQGSGTRGDTGGQKAPGPDQREVARGNQYGEAGEAASRQVKEQLTEHGQELAPQSRENLQLPKRAGERENDLPTPAKED